jgi:hypothetical protein
VSPRLRDVHDHPREELPRVERLDLAFSEPRAFMAGFAAVARLAKTVPGHLLEADRPAHDVPRQPLNRRQILGLYSNALVHREAGVSPRQQHLGPLL